MEIQQTLTLLLAAAAVVLGVLILAKVSKLITMLRTPIVKKLSPDMNLKPSSRHPVGAQEMASRGDRHNKDNRNIQNRDRSVVVNKDNNNRPERTERPEQRPDRPDRGMGQNRDRNNGRNDRNDRRNNRGDRPNRRPDFANNDSAPVESSFQAAPVVSESAPASFAPAPIQEGRRPLAPRVPVNTPAAPVMESVAVAPVVEEVLGAEFDPSKVRYGRRNFVKKLPDVDGNDAPASTEAK